MMHGPRIADTCNILRFIGLILLPPPLPPLPRQNRPIHVFLPSIILLGICLVEDENIYFLSFERCYGGVVLPMPFFLSYLASSISEKWSLYARFLQRCRNRKSDQFAVYHAR